jgi:hypothetical protein
MDALPCDVAIYNEYHALIDRGSLQRVLPQVHLR